MKNIILDLCGGTGSWSKPYKKAKYRVFNITLPDYDILQTYFSSHYVLFRGPGRSLSIDINDIYGIIAAPPCTMFSLARTNAKTPRDLQKGMEIVRMCMHIIWMIQENKQPTGKKNTSLKFWALENPYGMLKYFLGQPILIFEPYNYGDSYRKKTAIWGNFNHPPFTHFNWSYNKFMKFDKLKTKEIHPEYYGKLNRTERRAITPSGFAKAFFKANQ